MPGPSPVRHRLTALALGALLVAGVLATTGQAVAAPVARPAVDKVERVKGVPKVLKLKDVPISSRQGRSYSRVPAPDGTRSSVVAEPGPGDPRSTWRVVCNGVVGFDGSPSCVQAKAAFQSAVDIWSRIVASPITIHLNVSFAQLPQDVLGSAYSPYLYTNQARTTLHVSALADALQNRDIADAVYGVQNDPDIDAEFTTDSSINWYFGTDGAAAAGQVDFKSVVLHEIGHGLGFAGTMDVSGGNGTYGSIESPGDTVKPIGFDREAFDAATGGNRLISKAAAGASSAALGSSLTSGSVFWGGAQGVSAAGGTRPKLYAPSSWEGGSSFSHLDEATFAPGNANSLMTPFLTANEAVHSPGPIAVGILVDQGWNASLPADAAPAAPGAPTGVSGVRGNGSVQVSWSAASANGSPISAYTVTASPGGATCSTSGLSCTVSGLTNGTAYTFTVRATNGVGTGPASAASAAVTPAAVPSAPTGVAGTRGNGSVQVSWAAAAGNGSPVTGYTVLASPGDATCTTSGLTCAVSGLANGTTYTFTVRATNAAGQGPASTPSAAVTPAGPPAAPASVTGARGNGQVTLSWAAASSNGSDVTGYTAVAAPGGASCTTAGLSCTVTGLTNGTAYTFTVRATNAIGNGPASAASAAVTPAGPPSAPSSVSAVRGDRSVKLTWPAAGNNGSPVTGYRATAAPGGAACTTTGALTCTVTGLTNGTAYTFTVTATNAMGTGPASPVSAAATPADTTAPRVTVNALPVFSTATTNGVSYSATDASSGVLNYDVAYKRAAYNGGFSRWVYPTSWQKTTARSVSMGASKGATTCFVVRSRDKANNLSAWSAARCTASPLDDRSLVSSSGWTKASSRSYYGGTYATIARTGATLTRTSVKTKRISIVATKCSTCGTVGVYLNGRLLRNISLYAKSTAYKQIITVSTYSTLQSGTVMIKTLSSKRVHVDGLAVGQL